MRGKYDVVYMVKDSSPNEELRYSLRSVEKNWGPRGKVWIFGGCPPDIRPDRYVPVDMILEDKWENTHRMMKIICQCGAVSEDFWFFNDDFFVVRPASEDMPQQYNGLLPDVVREVEKNPDASALYWTAQLRKLIKWAEREGRGQVNYEVHKPMRLGRKRMLAVMDLFPDVLFTRSLYGNYYAVGGEDSPDVLVKRPAERIGGLLRKEPVFLSSTEESFSSGEIGRYIRERFPEKCRWEK